ncbi:hypothetical protein EMIHUDRAFT_357167 [Emiliania huxleyi CCMP1516]|uniref:Uncharacterized protein n=2 Tax=Emiliania huxleyi TaxID=2903 RepID=A0A0D3INS6_EMIH1|nr:hypothetical protein EMIHUDRAFT_357167 [Emiliania huxleyi CCMP1516]EOD12911.1 hypothetical protein EMIHUDRAFT_357167 [Emiliania huxleyi CCMP1516]|eukprot:XP_005765340.1 hypothetical protein EMIHUDRAFT_357167 [Emiliania huxleyi CCMP1516]
MGSAPNRCGGGGAAGGTHGFGEGGCCGGGGDGDRRGAVKSARNEADGSGGGEERLARGEDANLRRRGECEQRGDSDRVQRSAGRELLRELRHARL